MPHQYSTWFVDIFNFRCTFWRGLECSLWILQWWLQFGRRRLETMLFPNSNVISDICQLAKNQYNRVLPLPSCTRWCGCSSNLCQSQLRQSERDVRHAQLGHRYMRPTWCSLWFARSPSAHQLVKNQELVITNSSSLKLHGDVALTIPLSKSTSCWALNHSKAHWVLEGTSAIMQSAISSKGSYHRPEDWHLEISTKNQMAWHLKQWPSTNWPTVWIYWQPKCLSHTHLARWLCGVSSTRQVSTFSAVKLLARAQISERMVFWCVLQHWKMANSVRWPRCLRIFPRCIRLWFPMSFASGSQSLSLRKVCSWAPDSHPFLWQVLRENLASHLKFQDWHGLILMCNWSINKMSISTLSDATMAF